MQDIVDKKQLINNHTITVGWLLESLRENDETFKKLHGDKAVKEVTYKDVSDCKGFASEILRCTLTFVDDDSEYTTILKIPGFESMVAALKSSVKNPNMEAEITKSVGHIHDMECDFYKNTAPLLGTLTPKVFKMQDWIHGKQDGCIHMEDLTKVAKNLIFFESINLSQVKSYVRQLAKMNKNILAADPKLWQGKYAKNQEIMLAGLAMAENKKAMMDKFLNICRRKDAFEPLLKKFDKFFKNKEYHTYAYLQSYKDLNIQPVLVHGDAQCGNVMWAIDENGDIQNEVGAIVDWQTVQEGSPMLDLMRFLMLSADGVVRRQAETFIFDYYLECLKKEFGGDASKVPYTKEQLQKSYNIYFLSRVSGLGVGVMFLFNVIHKLELNERIKDAYFDFGVLKALHGLEDAARLLEDEMKDFYEKYGI